MMDLLEAARATAAGLVGDNCTFSGVSTDSRTIAPGELFVALRGEHFDGHHYVAAAQARGAAAAVVASDAVDRLRPTGLPLIVVAETRLSLGALAADWRSRFTLPLIAVTGSNGKTTTKEMIASILRAAHGDTVLSTQGNYNNDIGLPLTLLRLHAGHRAAIIEMGMNHPGEIAYLAGIARPGVAVVTNAQRAHLAGMGTVEAIAREKGSIYSGLDENGVAVFCADDPWADLWRQQSQGLRRMSFGFAQAADVSGRVTLHGLENRLLLACGGDETEVVLALPGRHNARNALAAAAAALAAGIPLATVQVGLNSFRGLKGRLQLRQATHGAQLLDDSYNANPDSVRAGIDVLAATVGRKILVLGDMGEIGEMSAQFHDEIGGYAKSQGIDRLLALGEASALAAHNFGAGGEYFTHLAQLIDVLRGELGADTTVLVKGSRFMRMERVVEALCVPAGEDA
ncbi:UDP-N-acetylmuramoyl-tripeptide--D-alanyl-D-alanine ligase [Accumulibacter sp.]|uniref:UDP-N-acetylmuramoyl-tripeptide--D-alanyl-D- alanine ligase n=1 Tax=Accumulibacter sp. TaxID=2053492 RepID=UPI001AC2F0EA|nr:UDP-N-acetylmuramoyl-tripeptide--D-alanyl-D-alanine ligase [Accumulibacter sp.]MBN8453782.1 UDP-N-acetylmuramoyl-tripeptide--D-alanyl-D-alanine ligase [Accumulibacter sp.]MBO3706186.1 UDP-N-acetylmuramoyl-tripeptide--D-alanyl-D-alanine ligase [Candidatus Accumulibacter conexus]